MTQDNEQRAATMLAARGWFPSAGSVPFDVARSEIAKAFATPSAAEAALREQSVGEAFAAADYLISLYERLWKGGVVRDLAEAISHYDTAKRAALTTLSPTTEKVTIPDGMRPWAGGDSAPEDWDRGPVLFRDGKLHGAPEGYVWKLGWGHHYGSGDVIAYTPRGAA